PLVVLAAARSGYEDLVAETSMPELPLSGVDRDAAAAILDARAGTLNGAARTRLLSEAAGNPLALVELPVSAGEGGAWMPLSARLGRAFAGRWREMPAATRLVLLVAAVDVASTVDEVLAAAGVERDALDPAIEAGLIVLEGDSVRYRHTLVRSAI